MSIMNYKKGPQKPAELRNMGALEETLLKGDLSSLDPEQRVKYYLKVCQSIGLNPMTRPLEYMTFQGKLVLYARKDCAEQLRKLHNVSLKIVGKEKIEDVLIVTSLATMPDGRSDESTGAVFLGRATGEALANAYMKAETKAKRRVTLSICGLGFLDETEVEDAIKHENYISDDQIQKEMQKVADKRDSTEYSLEARNEAIDKVIDALLKLGAVADDEAYAVAEGLRGKQILSFTRDDFKAVSEIIQALRSGKLEWDTVIDMAHMKAAVPEVEQEGLTEEK